MPIAYPGFQFDGGRVVRDLPAVLQTLSDAGADEWAQLRFFAGANARLGGRSPMDALRAGEVERVLCTFSLAAIPQPGQRQAARRE